MKDHIRQAMEDGAFGISTGLRYPFGRYAFTDEVVELCKVVAEYGGIHISHMRSESDTVIESAREVIQISEETGVPGSITHHKAMFPENWGKVTETMRLIDEARARRLEVICDFYPWTHAAEGNLGGRFLQYLITPEDKPEDIKNYIDNLVEVISEGETWARIKKTAREMYEKEYEAYKVRKEVLGKKGINAPVPWNPETFTYIVHSETHPELISKNLREAAEILEMDDFWDAARKVYIDDQGKTLSAGGIMREEDVITVLKHPTSAISTDGSTSDVIPDTSAPFARAHPRNYGSFAKVLQRYVREMKVISLEEGVRKMTSLPTKFLGISDRGLIAEGMWADVTIFDPQKITNKATFADPAVYPDGIHYVLVNGQIALDQGKETDVLAGKVLFRA
jgi:N-acyl-D-amino-acid deacylase